MKHNFEKVTWTDHMGMVWVDELCTFCGLELEFAGGREHCDARLLWEERRGKR